MHIRGSAATDEMQDAVGIGPADRVLDIGCGIGGPARRIAARVGCTVTGIDLTPEFCNCARVLNRCVGLEDRLEIVEGNALDMPFAPESFDVAVTLHAAMNIADKAQLYREIARVLRSGGRFALYDVMQGPGGDVRYPVPWATTSGTSHLAPPETVRALLTAVGFETLRFDDLSGKALAWIAARRAERTPRAEPGMPDTVAGASVTAGGDMTEKLRNVARNLREKRIVTLMGVFGKP